MHVLSELATIDAALPGWGAFIPIYNLYLQVKLAGYSGWLTLLYFVPLVNFIVAIVVAVGMARAFGRGALYGFVMHFVLQPIGFLVTGFGPWKYEYAHRWSPARWRRKRCYNAPGSRSAFKW